MSVRLYDTYKVWFGCLECIIGVSAEVSKSVRKILNTFGIPHG